MATAVGLTGSHCGGVVYLSTARFQHPLETSMAVRNFVIMMRTVTLSADFPHSPLLREIFLSNIVNVIVHVSKHDS